MAVWQKLLDGLKAAVELKIITYIGDVEMSGDDICKPEISLPQGPHTAMVTCINLVEGDITNCIPVEYAKDEKAWIRNYHDTQVKQGREIIDRNLRLISDLGKTVAEAISELRKAEQA